MPGLFYGRSASIDFADVATGLMKTVFHFLTYLAAHQQNLYRLHVSLKAFRALFCPPTLAFLI